MSRRTRCERPQASEHMATQTSFVTGGHASRAKLGMQIRLTNASADLETLRVRLGYQTAASSNAAAPRSAWKCPLGRENDGTAKGATMLVSKRDLL